MHFRTHEYHVPKHDPLDIGKLVAEKTVVFDDYSDKAFKKGDFISIDGTRGECTVPCTGRVVLTHLTRFGNTI